MSAPTDARVRGVMRERGCGYREACAWLGQRGAEALARRRAARAARRERAEAWRARTNAEF